MTMHNFLRTNTRQWHDRVDQAFTQFDLTTLSGYGTFLKVHCRAIERCESDLADWNVAERFPGWMGAMRMPALLADLDQLSLSRPPPLNSLPGAASPRAVSDAELVGMMYVLEGSRLGGRVLAKCVRQSSDARCRSATAYLNHDGGVSWQSFLGRLSALRFSNQQMNAALAAAIEIFGQFDRALTDSAENLEEFE